MHHEERRAGVRALLGDIARFTAVAGTRPLRPYQSAVARAVIESIRTGRGDVITVMMARQMGKNQTSAALEHYLLNLYSERGGQIVKCAPTFRPQVITSKQRLERELSTPFSAGRWSSAHGYSVALGNARILFLSADRASNVVGATADLLLEVDEAQSVDEDKYLRDFRPMASTTNATTVLYGTAWTEDCLLERQRQINGERERRLGRRLHFAFTWETLAALNPAYGRFVRGEIARLGADHPVIRTQYRLEAVAALGRLFSPAQHLLLQGRHARLRQPPDGGGDTYVAGVDIAGEEHSGPEATLGRATGRDSTVVTIGRVSWDSERTVHVEVVEHLCLTGVDHRTQMLAIRRLVREVWNCRRVVVDATGIGAGIASWLAHDLGSAIVDEVVFTAPVKSRLGFLLVAMINTGRCRLYARDDSTEVAALWREVAAARYTLQAHEQMRWGVEPAEGHDDYLMSLALCCQAAESATRPAAEVVIPPLIRDYGDSVRHYSRRQRRYW